MFKKLVNIYVGWKNYVWENQEVEKEAKKRARICANCDHSKISKFEIIKDKKLKEVEGMICGLCLCPLSAKLRSTNDPCSLNKW